MALSHQKEEEYIIVLFLLYLDIANYILSALINSPCARKKKKKKGHEKDEEPKTEDSLEPISWG